jgi:hypothetical protein
MKYFLKLSLATTTILTIVLSVHGMAKRPLESEEQTSPEAKRAKTEQTPSQTYFGLLPKDITTMTLKYAATQAAIDAITSAKTLDEAIKTLQTIISSNPELKQYLTQDENIANMIITKLINRFKDAFITDITSTINPELRGAISHKLAKSEVETILKDTNHPYLLFSIAARLGTPAAQKVIKNYLTKTPTYNQALINAEKLKKALLVQKQFEEVVKVMDVPLLDRTTTDFIIKTLAALTP